nr:MAG TPA: hypothetical protein [Caudoviricetes sp.]
MARIIYKKGCEGQNRLESIEGIGISLLNGQRALIYPRYAERILLKNAKYYGQEPDTEISALKKTDNLRATRKLDICGSPAVEFVSLFRSDKYGIFVLPTLLAAMEIQDQKKDIDALAETIEGADLLRDFTSYVWSCSRYNEDYGWIANGYNGFSSYSNLCNSFLAVPTILYREIK